LPEETPKAAQPAPAAAAQPAPAATAQPAPAATEAPKAEAKAKVEAKRPRIPAAQKLTRMSAIKHIQNKSAKSNAKTIVKDAENLIAEGKTDEAKAAVVKAISTLDKAAERGIIPANNAARRKSRLMKKFNSAGKAS
jgi:small subunit ribosomal protein S20